MINYQKLSNNARFLIHTVDLNEVEKRKNLSSQFNVSVDISHINQNTSPINQTTTVAPSTITTTTRAPTTTRPPTTTPPPLPAQIPPLNQPVIWGEASSAYNLGMSRASPMALSGKAGSGCNYKIAHPWYAPWNQARNQNYITNWAQQAKNEGYQGIGVDLEGWMNTPTVLGYFWNARNTTGLPLIIVPKASLEPGGAYLNGNFANSVSLLQQKSDCSIMWAYGADGAGYLSYVRAWRNAGYTKRLGFTQDMFRTWSGYRGGEAMSNGKRVWQDVAEKAKANSHLFMLFLGNHPLTPSSELNKLKAMYGY